MTMFSGPVLVHSDIGRGILTAKRGGFEISPGDIPGSLTDFLARLCSDGKEALTFPAFNYDFGSTLIFDLENDPIQVGALPESLRIAGEFERTEVPFFSFLRLEAATPLDEGPVLPFGEKSFFGHLSNEDGTILLLGVGVEALTFIHHVESSMIGGPPYRYEKAFSGVIRKQGRDVKCSVSMHVRPSGLWLEYDWPKIEQELRRYGVMKEFAELPGLLAISARAAKSVLLERLQADPLYLLEPSSRRRVESHLVKGTTRLKIEDFEKSV